MADGVNPALFDLVIVGAGLTGAALAASLSGSSLRIALLEAAPKAAFLQATDREAALPDSVSEFDTRVSALTQASVSFLEDIGVWQSLSPQRMLPYQMMHVWDALGTESIHFDAAELHANALGTILENSQLLQGIHHQLESQDNVTCLWESPALNYVFAPGAEQDECIIHLENGRQLQARLLVAADGANSRIRSTFGFETREWDYGQHSIVATVRTEHSHQNAAWQRFSEDGPLAFLPLPDAAQSGCLSSIVWSCATDRARTLMALDDSGFSTALEREFESRLGHVLDISKRSGFPLRQRHAKRYVKRNVALIGDAAHTIHPLAGQGLNLGFKDVSCLSMVIKDSLAQGLPLNHDLMLKRYQRERQVDNLAMMAVMEGFKRLFGSSDPLVRWARNAGMSWVNGQGLLKKQIVRQAMGI